jgi:hypothetical protein
MDRGIDCIAKALAKARIGNSHGAAVQLKVTPLRFSVALRRHNRDPGIAL